MDEVNCRDKTRTWLRWWVMTFCSALLCSAQSTTYDCLMLVLARWWWCASSSLSVVRKIYNTIMYNSRRCECLSPASTCTVFSFFVVVYEIVPVPFYIRNHVHRRSVWINGSATTNTVAELIRYIISPILCINFARRPMGLLLLLSGKDSTRFWTVELRAGRWDFYIHCLVTIQHDFAS